ncbi:MAG: sugar kinase [Proteobacteria bacterium]|nr:sugar kinase [Pseudomonadota bacterium]
MIELSPRERGLLGLGFGGDTLNTAVYLARLGVAVDYVTALGDDGFSERMLAAWRDEGVGTGLVVRMPGRLPGLYMIEVDARGERRFHYWRQNAPARELFALPETERIVAALAGYDLIYLSGISLSLYGEKGRAVLFAALDHARRRGGRVAFDCNYRARSWPTADAARAAITEMLRRVDIVLTGLDDERALFGDADGPAAARRLRTAGVAEIVVKDGDAGAYVVADSVDRMVVAEPVARPVDTTAAGDSFNASYLAARLAGGAPLDAARAGHHLAAAVIQHPGAIIPRTAMPELFAAPARSRMMGRE